jgi:dTDP-4-amino-4,6-dideoxygalactose transaminase
MPEFNAALGLAGLGLVDAKIHRQNEIATIYTAGLSTARGIRFQKVHDGDLSTYKDYSFHVDEREFGWSRDQVAAALAAENIETKQYFFPPLNRQRLYHTYATPDLKNTDCIADGVLSLPIYQSLSNEIVEGIVDAVQQLSRIRH